MTGYICDDCAAGHIVTPATIRMDWDLGSKWLCEECAKQYPGWLGQHRIIGEGAGH